MKSSKLLYKTQDSQINYDIACTISNIQNINYLWSKIKEKIYPIGYIYESTAIDTVQEINNILGGTWEKYAEGSILAGVNNSDSAFTYNITNKRGEKQHILTLSEIPIHSHNSHGSNTGLTSSSSGGHTHSVNNGNFDIGHVGTVNYYSGAIAKGSSQNRFNSGGNSTYNPFGTCSSSGGHTHSINSISHKHVNFSSSSRTSSAIGSGAAHSNMPPYITVYRYVKIAN